VTENPAYFSMLEATQNALHAAIEVARRDRRISEISKAIGDAATREGFKPISNLSGHTVQQYIVHAGKSIPSQYSPNLPVLKKDDVFAIEPFLTQRDAAGYVVDGPQETIFSLVIRKKTGIKEMDDLLDRIWESRKTLPFTPRWFESEYREGRLMQLLKELERRRLVRTYPILVEDSGKPVAQFEHTMAFEEDGNIVVLT
jgi:methionyl aminopeptidase